MPPSVRSDPSIPRSEAREECQYEGDNIHHEADSEDTASDVGFVVIDEAGTAVNLAQLVLFQDAGTPINTVGDVAEVMRWLPFGVVPRFAKNMVKDVQPRPCILLILQGRGRYFILQRR